MAQSLQPRPVEAKGVSHHGQPKKLTEPAMSGKWHPRYGLKRRHPDKLLPSGVHFAAATVWRHDFDGHLVPHPIDRKQAGRLLSMFTRFWSRPLDCLLGLSDEGGHHPMTRRKIFSGSRPSRVKTSA